MKSSQRTAKTVFFVLRADDEQLLRLGLWVVTAASVGEEVDVLLCAPALARLADGSFDAAAQGTASRAAGLGLPPPTELLAQAKMLGPVRLLGCETEMLLAGLETSALEGKLDDIVSLPSFWRAHADSRIVTL